MDGIERLALEQAVDAVADTRERFFALTDSQMNNPSNEITSAVISSLEKNEKELLNMLNSLRLNGTVKQGVAYLVRGGRLDIVDDVVPVNE